jgi:hypothetical protein
MTDDLWEGMLKETAFTLIPVCTLPQWPRVLCEFLTSIVLFLVFTTKVQIPPNIGYISIPGKNYFSSLQLVKCQGQIFFWYLKPSLLGLNFFQTFSNARQIFHDSETNFTKPSVSLFFCRIPYRKLPTLITLPFLVVIAYEMVLYFIVIAVMVQCTAISNPNLMVTVPAMPFVVPFPFCFIFINLKQSVHIHRTLTIVSNNLILVFSHLLWFALSCLMTNYTAI